MFRKKKYSFPKAHYRTGNETKKTIGCKYCKHFGKMRNSPLSYCLQSKSWSSFKGWRITCSKFRANEDSFYVRNIKWIIGTPSLILTIISILKALKLI